MIQRIQSVWLLLAAVCAALTFKYSFYSGNKTGSDNISQYVNLNASSQLLLIILASIVAAASLILIFFYKDRKKQMWLTVLLAIISIASIVICFMQIKTFTSGAISLTAILYFLVPVFLLLAARGIWKDEKIVKSLDRLR